jgi:hypothetical protein
LKLSPPVCSTSGEDDKNALLHHTPQLLARSMSRG